MDSSVTRQDVFQRQAHGDAGAKEDPADAAACARTSGTTANWSDRSMAASAPSVAVDP